MSLHTLLSAPDAYVAPSRARRRQRGFVLFALLGGFHAVSWHVPTDEAPADRAVADARIPSGYGASNQRVLGALASIVAEGHDTSLRPLIERALGSQDPHIEATRQHLVALGNAFLRRRMEQDEILRAMESCCATVASLLALPPFVEALTAVEQLMTLEPKWEGDWTNDRLLRSLTSLGITETQLEHLRSAVEAVDLVAVVRAATTRPRVTLRQAVEALRVRFSVPKAA